MAAPKFCILGGGVSGLACARLLQRSLPEAQVTVLGAGSSLVRSARGAKGQVVEQGFQSSILVDKNGREALGFLKLLKLDDEVLSANIEASARRHLLRHGRVTLIPGPQHVLRYAPALLAELLWPRGREADESVEAFVVRRGSRGLAALAAALCRGQLAGDSRELSVRSCFPRLFHNERRYGSVFLGAALSSFLAYRERSWMALDLLDPLLQRVVTGGRSYSLKSGLGSLIPALEEQLRSPPPGSSPVELRQEAHVERLEVKHGRPHVCLRDGSSVEADCVLATIKPTLLAELLERSGMDSDGSFKRLLDIPHRSVAVVNIGYDQDVLKERRLRGAGYFVPSSEHPSMTAMIWDSQLFPERSDGTQVTLYFEHCQGDVEALALEAMKEQLAVHEKPSEVHVSLWPHAVPQYLLGHHEKMQELGKKRRQLLPWLQVAGPGYFARNLQDELVDARQLTDSLARRFTRFPSLVENELEEDGITRGA